ncbi:hypothetical protein DdX_16862 [Ditylenchus destructor]|uniref:Uncharacterized protein n=1 Tax=Ditylenchus destructor TaxID=166010 RepID=A0AAD4QTS7_9BILA|nr:hypothetical protein DdX_16862 [Ditylenchus destructor]
MSTRAISPAPQEDDIDPVVLLEEVIDYYRNIISSKSTSSLSSDQPTSSRFLQETSPHNLPKKLHPRSEYNLRSMQGAEPIIIPGGVISTPKTSQRKMKEVVKSKLLPKETGKQGKDGGPSGGPSGTPEKTEYGEDTFAPCEELILKRIAKGDFVNTSETLAKMMHEYCFKQKSLKSIFTRIEAYKYGPIDEKQIDIELELRKLEKELEETRTIAKKRKAEAAMSGISSTKIERKHNENWTPQNCQNLYSVVDKYSNWPPSSIAKCFVRNGHLKRHSLEAICKKAEERRCSNILNALSKDQANPKYAFNVDVLPNFKWTGDARFSFISL